MNKYDKIKEPHRDQPVFHKGKKLETADAAMIMIHGRGATAESILTLADEFGVGNVAYIAPQANMNTWYPYSFLSPLEMNEPGITSGLQLIDSIINDLLSKGFSTNRIFLLGFSQGACLSLEYAARNPAKFGGVVGLSGGLIGPNNTPRKYSGSFDNTVIFLGCSDVDPHIPIERVDETEKVFLEMNADVTKRIYKGMGHSINRDEINFVKRLLKGTE
ncbi:MAG: dienelactone hydrolase family protein [Bacteroidota bacterium]